MIASTYIACLVQNLIQFIGLEREIFLNYLDKPHLYKLSFMPCVIVHKTYSTQTNDLTVYAIINSKPISLRCMSLVALPRKTHLSLASSEAFLVLGLTDGDGIREFRIQQISHEMRHCLPPPCVIMKHGLSNNVWLCSFVCGILGVQNPKTCFVQTKTTTLNISQPYN